MSSHISQKELNKLAEYYENEQTNFGIETKTAKMIRKLKKTNKALKVYSLIITVIAIVGWVFVI